MWENINKEVEKYCQECKCESCKKYFCLAYRIKILLGRFFDYKRANIDEFFNEPDRSQFTLFDFIGGDNE